MENNKTVEFLNTKAWYRTVKVVYILSVLVVIFLIFSIFLDSQVLDIPNSKIICQYGNEKSFLIKELYKNSVPTILEIYDDYNDLKNAETSLDILGACEVKEIKQLIISGRTYGDVTPYVIEKKYKIQFDYLLIALLVTTAIFEAIRRIFYYIVLGTINPQGKHGLADKKEN